MDCRRFRTICSAGAGAFALPTLGATAAGATSAAKAGPNAADTRARELRAYLLQRLNH